METKWNTQEHGNNTAKVDQQVENSVEQASKLAGLGSAPGSA